MIIIKSIIIMKQNDSNSKILEEFLNINIHKHDLPLVLNSSIDSFQYEITWTKYVCFQISTRFIRWNCSNGEYIIESVIPLSWTIIHTC